MIDSEVRIVMKFVDKIFGSPSYLRELLFVGKYVTVLYLILSFFFLGMSRFGGPLGSTEYVGTFLELAFMTVGITLITEILASVLRRRGSND